jgi:hypothetical protein
MKTIRNEHTTELPVWTRSETLALAQQSCVYCFGLGQRLGRHGAETPCNCVFRAIFRACYNRFCALATLDRKFAHVSAASLENRNGARGQGMWGRKDEEYCADFCLVAQRSLTIAQHRLFRFHYLLGADWKACCAKLDMDRGAYFHESYRIEQTLGRVFRELQPHALFPLDQYFALGRGESAHPLAVIDAPPPWAPPGRKLIPLRASRRA